MIIVDERNFVTRELEDKGFQVFDFYDHHRVLSLQEFCKLPLQRRADVLLVDTQTVLTNPKFKESFFSVLNTFLGVVFLHEQRNGEAQKWVEEQSAFITKIVGEYALPMPTLQWTIFSNQLQFFWSILQDQKILQKHLAQFSKELDQVLQTAAAEMSKARKIHDVLLPKRSDEVRGVQFSHKYTVGDGGGGEFYDMFHTPHTCYQVVISSESYLISSALMGILNNEKKNFSIPEFLDLARQEIATINEAKKKRSEVQVSIIELDLSKLRLKLHGWGKPELHSLDNGLLELAAGEEYKMSKGEKIIVFSPGFLFNWNEGSRPEVLSTFLGRQRQLGAKEILMELFFQLRQSGKDKTHKKDATVVVMEVNRHGIHKV